MFGALNYVENSQCGIAFYAKNEHSKCGFHNPDRKT